MLLTEDIYCSAGVSKDGHPFIYFSTAVGGAAMSFFSRPDANTISALRRMADELEA